MSKTEVSGAGIRSDSVNIGEINAFTIYPKTEDDQTISSENVKVTITGPGKANANVYDNSDGTFDVEWIPDVPGVWTIRVTINNEDVPDSPYIINLGGETSVVSPSATIARGPGISSDQVLPGERTVFSIVPADEQGRPVRIAVSELKIGFSGPSQATVDLYDNDDGSFDVEWIAPDPGEYTISISIGGQDINGSPFKIRVPGASPAPQQKAQPTPDPNAPKEALPSKSVCFGDGIDGNLIKAKQPNVFFVRPIDRLGNPFNGCKLGDVKVGITASFPGIQEPHLDLAGDGTIQVTWIPPRVGDYKISVRLYGQHIQGSPYDIEMDLTIPPEKLAEIERAKAEEPAVLVPSNATAAGPGLQQGTVGVTTAFTIYPKDQRGNPFPLDSVNKVSVGILGPKVSQAQIYPNEDGTFDVEWTPPEAGGYTINVKIDKEPITGSPFRVGVLGSGSNAPTSAPSKPTQTVQHEPPVKAAQPVQKEPPAKVVQPVQHEPPAKVVQPVQHEPPAQTISPKAEPAKQATGPKTTFGAGLSSVVGLTIEKVQIGNPFAFTLVPKDKSGNTFDEISENNISIKIEGPGNPVPNVFENPDKTFDIEWIPSIPGLYLLTIKVFGEQIKGSPFTFNLSNLSTKERVQTFLQGTDKTPVERAVEQPQVTLKGAVSKVENWEKGDVQKVEVKRMIEQPQVNLKGAVGKVEEWEKGEVQKVEVKKMIESPAVVPKAALTKVEGWEKGEIEGKIETKRLVEQPQVTEKGAVSKVENWEKGDVEKVEIKRMVESPKYNLKGALNKVEGWEKGDVEKVEVKKMVAPPAVNPKGALDKAEGWEKGKVEGKIEVKKAIDTIGQPPVPSGVAKNLAARWEGKEIEPSIEIKKTQPPVGIVRTGTAKGLAAMWASGTVQTTVETKRMVEPPKVNPKAAKEKAEGWEKGEVEGKIEVKRWVEQPAVNPKAALEKVENWEKGDVERVVEVKRMVEQPQVNPNVAKEKAEGWEKGEVEGKIEVKRWAEQPQVNPNAAKEKAEGWEKGEIEGKIEVKRWAEQPQVNPNVAKEKAEGWEKGDVQGKIEVKRWADQPQVNPKAAKEKAESWESKNSEQKLEERMAQRKVQREGGHVQVSAVQVSVVTSTEEDENARRERELRERMEKRKQQRQ